AEALDRVRPSLADVLARVPAASARECDPEEGACRSRRLEREREPQEGVIAAGTADGESVVARPVEVDEEATGDHRGVERSRAVEALLLRDGEEELERPVLHVDVLRDRQRGGDADAVVGP